MSDLLTAESVMEEALPKAMPLFDKSIESEALQVPDDVLKNSNILQIILEKDDFLNQDGLADTFHVTLLFVECEKYNADKSIVANLAPMVLICNFSHSDLVSRIKPEVAFKLNKLRNNYKLVIPMQLKDRDGAIGEVMPQYCGSTRYSYVWSKPGKLSLTCPVIEVIILGQPYRVEGGQLNGYTYTKGYHGGVISAICEMRRQLTRSTINENNIL